MYYKTPKDSETGRKFEELCNKIELVQKETYAFLDKWKVDGYGHSKRYISGGVDCILILNPSVDINPKEWVKTKGQEGEYKPNPRTKAGKEITKALNKLPNVCVSELNQCVGWDSFFANIGYRKDKDFYYFEASPKFFEETPLRKALVIPSDCIEILYSEYQKVKDA